MENGPFFLEVTLVSTGKRLAFPFREIVSIREVDKNGIGCVITLDSSEEFLEGVTVKAVKEQITVKEGYEELLSFIKSI
jgi:hypothetical protein